MQGPRRHLNVLQATQPALAVQRHDLQNLLMENLGCMRGCGGCPMKGGCGSASGKSAARPGKSVPEPLHPRNSISQGTGPDERARISSGSQSSPEEKPAYPGERDISRILPELLLSAELNLERRRISSVETGCKSQASRDRPQTTIETDSPKTSRVTDAGPLLRVPDTLPLTIRKSDDPGPASLETEGITPDKRPEKMPVPPAPDLRPIENQVEPAGSEKTTIPCLLAITSIHRAVLEREATVFHSGHPRSNPRQRPADAKAGVTISRNEPVPGCTESPCPPMPAMPITSKRRASRPPAQARAITSPSTRKTPPVPAPRPQSGPRPSRANTAPSEPRLPPVCEIKTAEMKKIRQSACDKERKPTPHKRCEPESPRINILEQRKKRQSRTTKDIELLFALSKKLWARRKVKKSVIK